MGDYSVEVTIYDVRNGEIVAALSNIEVEQDGLSEEAIEEIEEFMSVSINKYEEEGHDDF